MYNLMDHLRHDPLLFWQFLIGSGTTLQFWLAIGAVLAVILFVGFVVGGGRV